MREGERMARHELSAEQYQVIERAAASAYFRERMPVPGDVLEELPRDFSAFVNVPRQRIADLKRLYDEDDVDALLQADWEAALDCDAHFLYNGSAVTFATHVELENGTAVTVSIARNSYGGKPWYLSYVPDTGRLQFKGRAGGGAGALAESAAEPGSATASPVGRRVGAADAGDAAVAGSAAGSAAGGVGAAPAGTVAGCASAASTASVPVPASTPPAAVGPAPADAHASAAGQPPVDVAAPAAVAPEADGPAAQPKPRAGALPETSDSVRRAMLDLASTPAYCAHPVAPALVAELRADGRRFSQKVVLPQVFCSWVCDASSGALSNRADCREQLDRDWDFALEHGLVRYYEDDDGGNPKIFFPIGFLRADDSAPVEVGFWRNNKYDASCAGSLPWYASYVMNRAPQPRASEALFAWAHLGPVDRFLSDLAKMALPECWSFGSGEAQDYGILRSYIVYTFYRLQHQEPCGVLENEEMGIAAFNTGLVDRMYEPIYAAFSKNDRVDGPPWFFQEFCRAGSSAGRGYGTRLSLAFSELPPRATYFTSKDDLIYDTSRPLDINDDHILLENISRLPKDFLLDEVPRDARDLLDKIEEAYQAADEVAAFREPDERRAAQEVAEERFAELRAMIERDTKIQRRLRNRLRDAIGLALRRAEWNFRTAVPSYYPTTGRMNLLLPLDLTEDDHPDVALVVELVESGRYLARTILTMRMAYSNARLLCRPESDWLEIPRL